ncbi:MAG: prepilin-type N-terminal cleavage/methylation domain-containing protein, partial [Phycisphaerales bacterium]|nr:prepilin-type N-terminal cleavage/methylation domain-containing protein [Phycisphaerales bacterium]
MVAITNRAIAFRRSDHRAGRGFTLAEILVALGIMAIGMAMVAAIFPAALAFNKSSTNDTRGMIICENGFTLSEG